MMTELSLHVLDIAENSTRAGATLVQLTIVIQSADQVLQIEITDNGCGMDAAETANAADPFFTSRTTRQVGLGLPFFKYAAELTGGAFQLTSEKGAGTTVKASFFLSHIDCLPIGDLTSTIHTLMIYHPRIDFIYRYQYDQNGFTLDTREVKDILGDIPLDTPEISQYLMEFLTTNQLEADHGDIY